MTKRERRQKKKRAEKVEQETKKKEQAKKNEDLADSLSSWINSLSESDSMPQAYLYHILMNVKGGYMMDRASTLAYSILLAAIPLIMTLVQIISRILTHPESALGQMVAFLPGRIGAMLQAVIHYIAVHASGISIGIGIITALWLGSNGIYHFIRVVNDGLGFDKEGNAVMGRLMAIGYTVIFMVMIILALLFYVFYNQLLVPFFQVARQDAQMSQQWASFFAFMDSMFARILPIILFIFVLVIFFKSAPKTVGKEIRWIDALVGGGLSGLGIIINTWFYSLIVENVSKLSVYFGSLAGILFLLFWLRFSCFILIAGAEAVAVYRHIHRKEIFMEEGLSEADAEARIEAEKARERQRQEQKKADLERARRELTKQTQSSTVKKWLDRLNLSSEGQPSEDQANKSRADKQHNEPVLRDTGYRGKLPASRNKPGQAEKAHNRYQMEKGAAEKARNSYQIGEGATAKTQSSHRPGEGATAKTQSNYRLEKSRAEETPAGYQAERNRAEDAYVGCRTEKGESIDHDQIRPARRGHSNTIYLSSILPKNRKAENESTEDDEDNEEKNSLRKSEANDFQNADYS